MKGWKKMGEKKRKIVDVKRALKKCEALKPIVYDKDLSAFDITDDIDIFATSLELHDYDWMHYVLTAHLPTKAYGDMEIQFDYSGAVFSVMTVKARDEVYVLKFNTEIFKEHIIKFLQKQITTWDGPYGFNGIEETVHFYNAVLAAPDTHLFPEGQYNRAYFEERIDTEGIYTKKASLFSDLSDESLRAALNDFNVFHKSAMFPKDGALEQSREKYTEMYGCRGMMIMEKDLLRECAKRWNEAQFNGQDGNEI